MFKLIKTFIPFGFIFVLCYSQSIQGNVTCNSAIVEYTYVVRAMESPEDSARNSTYKVTASWPSSAAAAAGLGFTRTLLEYSIGDTVTTRLVPLVNEQLLALAGVALDVDLNDDGNFTIN